VRSLSESRRPYTKGLPNLAASMRLAIEVFDTFGPGPARVDDDTEAVS
jgi:hypothetical protein